MPRKPSVPFSQPNHSVLAVIECLQWLAMHGRPVSNIEMARTMGVHRNRANRLLKSLVIAGIALQGPDKKFAVGGGFHVLAAQSLHASGLLSKTLPVLESLHRFHSIVALGVLWKDLTTYLYFHRPDSTVAEGIGARGATPATQSSIGLSLLAQLGEEEIDLLYADRPIPDFDDLEALKAELARVRRQGYSRHAHRGDARHVSQAVAVRHHGRFPCAVALGETAGKLDEGESFEILREAALKIEAALG